MEQGFTDTQRLLMEHTAAIIELARKTDTSHSRAFLKAYHEAEADIAALNSHLPEAAIRGHAVVMALQVVGPAWFDT